MKAEKKHLWFEGNGLKAEYLKNIKWKTKGMSSIKKRRDINLFVHRVVLLNWPAGSER